MFSAQRHNGTFFGENPADGYLLPWTERNHPIELTWHHNVPMRRRPTHVEGSERPEVPRGAATINSAGYVEEADAPNRVQYMTGSQWLNLPSFDYVAFAGPSSNFQALENLLPFLQVRGDWIPGRRGMNGGGGGGCSITAPPSPCCCSP
jgi:hypothetical protein